MRIHRVVAVAGVVALVVSACSAGGTPKPSFNLPASVGAGEGALSVLAWPGYAENGSTDPTVNWVKPFEDQTGCKVTVQVFGTSDEAFSLYTTNPTKYDVVSASGDASLRLVRAGYVQPVNTDLVPNYADIFPDLKDKPYNTVDGVHYGIPHGRGANLLMWRTDKVTGTLDSWSAVFDQGSKYKGKLTAYDNPIYIADAALYLKATKPDLKITNPYELDDAQFKASVDLLKAQRQNIGEYWSDYTKEQAAFTSGDSTVGTTWQVIANLLDADKVKVKTALPKEGATGWSDTWMIASKAAHPNCMYKWMDWIISPKVNAEVAEWFGEAPSNAKSCAETADKNFCKTFHADDEAYFNQVSYWSTPRKQCGDARGDVCKDYSAWVQAWTEIKG
jgi:putative spermidine/putrescine transport system substrate-binding protein